MSVHIRSSAAANYGVPLVSDLIHCLFFPPSLATSLYWFSFPYLLPRQLCRCDLSIAKAGADFGLAKAGFGWPPKIQAVQDPQTVCHSRECVKLWSALTFEGLSLQEAECSSATGFVMDDKSPGRSHSCPSPSVRCEVFSLLERLTWCEHTLHLAAAKSSLSPLEHQKQRGKKKFWSRGHVLLLAWKDQL